MLKLIYTILQKREINVKNKLSKSELTSVAVMLFGLFFGAGNLIFPIYMGQLAGRDICHAILGFLITGVGLPLLGVTAIGISRSNGLIELSSKVGHRYGIFFTCALYLTIGPFFAIPRCATVPFTVGIEPILTSQADIKLALALFSAAFFIAVLGFSLRPGKILVWVGKILTPVFLLFLGSLLIAAIINPMGGISNIEPDSSYATGTFMTGFIEGYNTMDALAGLAFGIIIIDVIRNFGISEPGAIAKNTIHAGIFSCTIMAVIYIAVAIVGVQSRNIYDICKNGGEVFALVAQHYFGRAGSAILAVTVTLACLKTAVGLITSCSETFCRLFPNSFPYKVWAVIFCVFSFFAANIGLNSIIAYALPVLMFLYPLAITLILLGIFGNFFGHNKYVYGFVTGFTFVVAVFDFFAALPEHAVNFLHMENIINCIYKYLPLSRYGLGWLIPAFIGLIVGLATIKIKHIRLKR